MRKVFIVMVSTAGVGDEDVQRPRTRYHLWQQGLAQGRKSLSQKMLSVSYAELEQDCLAIDDGNTRREHATRPDALTHQFTDALTS